MEGWGWRNTVRAYLKEGRRGGALALPTFCRRKLASSGLLYRCISLVFVFATRQFLSPFCLWKYNIIHYQGPHHQPPTNNTCQGLSGLWEFGEKATIRSCNSCLWQGRNGTAIHDGGRLPKVLVPVGVSHSTRHSRTISTFVCDCPSQELTVSEILWQIRTRVPVSPSVHLFLFLGSHPSTCPFLCSEV